MKIAILHNYVPFTAGTVDHLAAALREQLIRRGHQAILVRVPFRSRPAESIVEHILAARLLCLRGVDRAIGLQFPAYFVPHDNKVVWLFGQFRQAYDLWGTPCQEIPDTPDGHRIREVIIESDNQYLSEARCIFSCSHAMQNRLKQFNHLDSKVLLPPLQRSDHFFCSGYGDYVFYPSRIGRDQRQTLVMESMKHCKSPVRLVIGGEPGRASDCAAIERIIHEANLESRVQFLPRLLTEQEKAELFAGALGCAYTPYQNDYCGCVPLESYHSRKPVISCTDSGDAATLVKDGETGFVVPPSPEAIGQAMDRLYEDRIAAARMGEAGYDLMNTMGINWDRVVERLTA